MQDVFLTSEELASLRKLIGEDSAACAVAKRSIGDLAQQACAKPIIIPQPMDQTTRCYFDEDTGHELVYDRNEPHRHRSTKGRVYRGPAYDRAWADITHTNNANDARDTALAAALLGDEEAGAFARELLLKYAACYRSYPPVGRIDWSWGRMTASGLEEAVWATSMLWAAEMLYKIGMLDDTQLAHLHRDLFEPVVELLWGEWPEYHNIRQWVNAAVGCIGLAFDDSAAKREAIFGAFGYRQQIGKCFQNDGLSWEGSPGYHAYGMTAMLILAEAMQRNNYRPYQAKRMRNMLLAPVRLMQPNGLAPALNDYPRSASFPTRLYATALNRFPSDQAIREAAGYCFDLWQQRNFRPDTGAGQHDVTPAYIGRAQIDWLLAWDAIDHNIRPQLASVERFDHSGVAIARPRPNDYVLLRCARRNARSHSHYDHLHLMWWHDGHCWLDDAGSGDYGAALHGTWFVQTTAHNTAVIDRATHERCDATLLRCDDHSLAGGVRPYPSRMPDVVMRREVHFNDNTLEDQFDVECAGQRLIDYLLHPAGRAELPADAQAVEYEALADRETYHQMDAVGLGYDVPQNVRQIRFGAERGLRWRSGNRSLHIDLSLLDETCKVLIASVPRDPRQHDAQGDMLILRQHAWGATFKVTMRSDVLDDHPRHTVADRTARRIIAKP